MPDAVFAPSASATRQPRGVVKVNDQAVAGWIHCEVNNNSFYEADTFDAVFAISALPNERNVAWWAQQTEIFVEIFAGFPSNPDSYTSQELQSLIYGRVDRLDYDPVARTLTVSGRDRTSDLIDTKTTEEFQNLTSSQIATQFAQRHGLTPVVTATTKKVGGYYKQDHVLVTNQHSEWDLLSYLAENEEFVVYVKGKDLHFEPRPDRSQATPYVLQWREPTAGQPVAQFNGKSLSLRRELTLAKGVVVWVQAINAKTGKSFSVSYPQNKAKGTRPGQSSPSAQVYTVRLRKKPMTPEQALQKAQEKHREISQHEVKLHATLPGDDVLAITNTIQVRGTGSIFDQTYYPDSITRHLSISDGYTMDVSAKNIAKGNEVPL